jgi:hypothetical protein
VNTLSSIGFEVESSSSTAVVVPGALHRLFLMDVFLIVVLLNFAFVDGNLVSKGGVC